MHPHYHSLIIPLCICTEEYPVEWHGVKLSRYIYNMKWWQKHIAQHSDRVSQLNSLSFVWERLQSPWNLLIDALGHYRSIYGNVLVPAKYVVPRTDDYPKACWDLPLGRTVQRLRIRHDFLQVDNAIERKNQLDGLGFVWDVSEYNFIRFLKALRHYDRLEKESLTLRGENSAIRVPSKYVIPNDERWPKEFWGYQLGAKCMAVRQKKLYIKSDPERKQALEDIGFRFNGNASLGWLDVVHAAAIYSQMHGRVLNVPLSFSVPTPTEHPECLDEWPWPERLWGLKLGQRLRDVRLKGAYLKGGDRNVRIAQLNNLGFIWQPKRGRRKRSTHDEEEDIIDDNTIRPVVDDDPGEHV